MGDINFSQIDGLNDLDFLEVVGDMIDELGPDEVAQASPSIYKRYLELLSVYGEEEEDDDEEEDGLNFKDLYGNKKNQSLSFSDPSEAYSASFLNVSPSGSAGGQNIAETFNRGIISNLFTKMRDGGYVGRYQSGGNVSPAFSRYMPVGNSTTIEGIVPVDSLIPIQTEEGELIVHPTMDVTKVNAKKRHHKLDENEVTDIVPEGSYILSRHGVVRIYKDEADKKVIETQNKPYNLYTSNAQPKVRTLGDMMSKKEMAPAELASSILKKYKIINHDDPFTDQTNKANKFNSGRYIKSIIELSEFDKKRKGISNGEDVSAMFGQAPDMWARDGGTASKMRYNSLPKANVGTFLKLGAQYLPAIASGLGSIFGNRAARKANEEQRKIMQDYANKYYENASKFNTLQGVANMAGTLMQDPTTQVAKRDSSYLQSMLNTMGSNRDRNAFLQDLASFSPDMSKMDPRYAQAVAGDVLGKQLRSISDFNAKKAATDQDLRNKIMGQMGETEFYNRQQDVSKFNQEQANRNRLMSLLSSQASGTLGSAGEILANKNAMETSIAKEYLAQKQKNQQDLWKNLLLTAGQIQQSPALPWSSLFKGGANQNITPGVNDPLTTSINNQVIQGVNDPVTRSMNSRPSWGGYSLPYLGPRMGQ